MVDKYIEQLRPVVNELFKQDSGGHDVSHMERTMNTALYLQEKEGGDRIVVAIASLLHDVHRAMQNKTGEFVSPTDSLPLVREILSKTDLSQEQVDKICYCVENHEHYNWNGSNVDDINTLILQDADNLDAIGAIGIGRTFSYGGANNMPMYDPDTPINEADDYSEFDGDGESVIHRFCHKSLKLENNMNTKTGKELAEKKTAFMKLFINEFLADWNASY